MNIAKWLSGLGRSLERMERAASGRRDDAVRKADILDRFIGFKERFRTSSQHEEKIMYYVMCDALMLPSPECEKKMAELVDGLSMEFEKTIRIYAARFQASQKETLENITRHLS